MNSYERTTSSKSTNNGNRRFSRRYRNHSPKLITMAKGIKMKGFKRGYNVMGVKKKLNLYGMGYAMYEVYEVSGPNVPSPKLFVDEASVHKYIDICERSKIEVRALAGKGMQSVKGVAALHKDILAEKELPELQTEVPNDRHVSKNGEDTDK